MISIPTERFLQRPENNPLRLNDAGRSYPVFAAGVFEGAENERAAAVVLHVVSQILSGDVGCATLVGTLDREPRAVVLVVLQRESGDGVNMSGAERMSDKNTRCTVMVAPGRHVL